MHSGAITDGAITASSSYDSASVGPASGRSALHFLVTCVSAGPFGRNYRPPRSTGVYEAGGAGQ